MSPKKLLPMLIILSSMFWSMNARGDPSTDKFLLIVSNPLYQTGLVTAALNTYQQDLQIEGWATTLITVNRVADPNADYICPDEAALKTLIQNFYSQGYDGFVIIGSPSHLPTAWWKCYFTDPDYTKCPTDLYYADMDEWIVKDGDVYVSFDAAGNYLGGNFGPELFFGRITAGPISSTIEEEAAKVALYLEKMHAYRVNAGNLTPEQHQRAFIFRDDDFSGKAAVGFEPYHEATSNIYIVLDRRLTNAAKLDQLLEEGYRFGEIWAHSTTNCFIVPHLATLDIQVNYLNLFVCGALNYSEANIGAALLFDTDKTCNITGSIGSWGIGLDALYYSQLNSEIPIGIAFRDLANRQIAAGEIGWPKGELVGDPLLKHTMNVANRPPRIANDLRELTAFSNAPFEFVFTAEDPEGDPLAVSIEDLPPDMSWNGNALFWTPSQSDERKFRTLTVKVVDNHDNSYREAFDIFVPGIDSLGNGDFEAGSGENPDFGDFETANCGAVFRWEPAGTGHNGTKCVSIDAETYPDDACWTQKISTLTVGHWYLLEGWIKGENIISHEGSIGANLCLFGTWDHSQAGFGTFGWMPVQLMFKAESQSVTIGCRLGYWTSVVTGKAWFDDIVLSDLTSDSLTADLLFADNDVELTKPAYTEGNIHSNEEVEFKQGKPSTHQGNISAVEGVYIGKKMTINGDVAAPEVKNYGTVNGNINIQAVTPISLPAQPVYSPNNDDRDIRGIVSLAPGQYGEITVRKNAVLNLGAGEYQLQHLEIHKNAAVNVDVSGGEVNIFICDELEFKGDGSFTAFGAPNPTKQVNIRSGYTKTIKVRKNSILNGCNLYAPAAAVEFAGNSFFKGFVCAREIEVQKNAALVTHQSSLTPQGAFYLAAGGDEEEADTTTSTSTAIPESYELSQNFPNPFNPSTTIRFSLPQGGPVSLKIYNIRGQLVKTLVDGFTEAGRHQAVWNGTDEAGTTVASGIYFCRFSANGFVEVKKMALVR